MKETTTSTSSHGVGWTLALAAAPVVYMLTLPPIVVLGTPRTMPAGSSSHPTWVEIYAVPYILAMEYTPLKSPLRNYGRWWERILE